MFKYFISKDVIMCNALIKLQNENWSDYKYKWLWLYDVTYNRHFIVVINLPMHATQRVIAQRISQISSHQRFLEHLL